MIFKKISSPLLVLLLLATLSSVAAARQTPLERVQEASDKLIKVLSDPAMQEPGMHKQAVARLRQTAEEYVDFRLVTMYAVGRQWLDMSQQMQEDLTEAFLQLLERSYLKRIPAYGGQNVDYKKELVSGKKAKVFTEIIDKDRKIVVEFRLRDTGEQWMVYDVVAEGVSLVSNYRTQFSHILDKGTPEDLLHRIRERITKLDQGTDDGTTDTL